MDRLILDTSVLISVERGVLALEGVVDPKDDVAVAAITAAELLVGIELANQAKAARREEFVETILTLLRVEPYDLKSARSHARLMAVVRDQGCPRGSQDLQIAAVAHATRRTVVTLDSGGFSDLPGVDIRVVSQTG